MESDCGNERGPARVAVEIYTAMGNQHRGSRGIRAQKSAHLAGYRFGHTLAMTGWGVFLVWATLLDALPGRFGIGRSIALAVAVVGLIGFAVYRPRIGGIVLAGAGVAAALLLNGSLLFALLAITVPALFFGATAFLIYPAEKR